MPFFNQMMTPEPIRVVLGGALTSTYQNLGTPLAHASVICKVVNNTNVDVFISLGTSVDEDIVPAGGFFLYDENANAVPPSEYKIAKNTQFQVRAPAGAGSQATATANVYLVTYYAA
jgi:hypothetical protein